MRHNFLIYTSCGVTFEEEAKDAAQAIRNSTAGHKEYEIIAVIRADAVVKPHPNMPITALIVGNRAAMKPAPEM